LTFKEISIDKITVDKNIRTDPDGELGGLMETIEKYELLQPVLVIPKDGQYELVSGHRRLEAMRARNEATVPCIIRNDLSEKNLPFIKLIENVQRKQLSSHELVQIFEEMKKNTPGLTQYQIARMVGKSTGWVNAKYKAGKIIAELIGQGVPEEAVDELTDAELMKLNRRVKNKKERAKIASKMKNCGDKDLLIQAAESYIGPQKHRTSTRSDMRRIGFQIYYSGKKNLLIVCRSSIVQNQVMSVLWKYGQAKTDEYRERLRLMRKKKKREIEERRRILGATD
jgi:ParB/RepB/Spo0J family partition protein